MLGLVVQDWEGLFRFLGGEVRCFLMSGFDFGCVHGLMESSFCVFGGIRLGVLMVRVMMLDVFGSFTVGEGL